MKRKHDPHSHTENLPKKTKIRFENPTKIPLSKILKKNLLEQFNFTGFLPLQKLVIPLLLNHHDNDFLIDAPTGCGKTLCYVYSITHILSSRIVPRLRALVVLPTKDLALQVMDVFESLLRHTDLSVIALSGKETFVIESERLKSHPYDIFVATPGRLMEHIYSNNVSLEHLRFLVVDEVDRLLAQRYSDFLPNILRLLDAQNTTTTISTTTTTTNNNNNNNNTNNNNTNNTTTTTTNNNNNKDNGSLLVTKRKTLYEKINCFPQTYPNSSCQKLIFSATLTSNPQKLNQLNLCLPHTITFSETGHLLQNYEKKQLLSFPAALAHYFLVSHANDKPLILYLLLKTIKGNKLCFTSSIESSHRLKFLLENFPQFKSKVAEYSSLLSKHDRTRVLQKFSTGEIEILISTDALARGMDIPDLPTVINYDVPVYPKTYLHRAGRTARAGKSGSVITICQRKEVLHFKRMLLNKFTPPVLKKFPLDRAEMKEKSTIQIYKLALEFLKHEVEDYNNIQQN